ncbi:MAG: eight-cysteine-cluster domain-containing protein [Candidatus Aenigmatarchaeota archaeon]
MKKLGILLLAFFLFQPALALEPFCGWSTYSFCLSDSDCKPGGCSGQVCEKIGEGTVTTCEFRECYVAENYNLSCQCINFKCQWYYTNKTSGKIGATDLMKEIFSYFIKINPILLLFFGVILFFLVKLVKLIAIILIILGLILLIFSLL